MRDRRAMATELKNAAAVMALLPFTTVDMAERTTQPAEAARTPSSEVTFAAAAAISAPAAAAASLTSSERTPPPSGLPQQRQKRPPPSALSSDDSLSDGGGVDAFDSNIIAQIARYGGRSSSDSTGSDESDSEECALPTDVRPVSWYSVYFSSSLVSPRQGVSLPIAAHA